VEAGAAGGRLSCRRNLSGPAVGGGGHSRSACAAAAAYLIDAGVGSETPAVHVGIERTARPLRVTTDPASNGPLILSTRPPNPRGRFQ
jgi:hypothetical protein